MNLFRRSGSGPVKVGSVHQAPVASLVPPSVATSTVTSQNGEINRHHLPEESLPQSQALEETAPEDDVIRGYDGVPRHSRVLTAGGVHAVCRLAKSVEYSIAAIETGPGRARILYDPEVSTRDVADALIQVRVKLATAGFSNDESDLRCKKEILAEIIADHRKRENVDVDESGAATNSKARKLWEDMVDLAVRERATDIHVQIVRNQASVKIRVDGELEPLRDSHNGVWSPGLAELAVSWGYNNEATHASNSDSQYQNKSNLYAMIKPRTIDGRQIALRYQSVQGAFGPKVVCRILNTDTEAPTKTYEELGYYKSHIKLFKEASRTPSGLIVFSGVTGSGKTTSQKTFVETHPGNGSSAFYSIEDPIEYPLRGVHQIPLQRDLLNKEKSTAQYSDVIGALVRADPDLVLIGEIRDVATASAVQQIVETGHMGVGTVHAHLISGIIPRLTDDEIGMSRKVLTGPNILALLNYQALVPLLCPHCKISGKNASEHAYIHHGNDNLHLADEGLEEVGRVIDTLQGRFGIHRDLYFFRRSGGCDHCNGRGTLGQTVVAEMLMPDRKWLTLTRDEDDYGAVMYYRSQADKRWDSDNMTGKTVFEHTLHKVLNGLVDPRQCERFDSLTRFDILDRGPLE